MTKVRNTSRIAKNSDLQRKWGLNPLFGLFCYTIYIMLSNGNGKTPLRERIANMGENEYICKSFKKSR
jgi:hypothetical protein